MSLADVIHATGAEELIRVATLGVENTLRSSLPPDDRNWEALERGPLGQAPQHRLERRRRIVPRALRAAAERSIDSHHVARAVGAPFLQRDVQHEHREQRPHGEGEFYGGRRRACAPCVFKDLEIWLMFKPALLRLA